MERSNGMDWKKDRIDTKLFKNGHMCNLLKYKYFSIKKIPIRESIV
jgi:hypothetical protein